MKHIINSVRDLPLKIAILTLLLANIALFSCQKDPISPERQNESASATNATDRDGLENLCMLTWNTHGINTPFGLFGGCSGNGCVELAEEIAEDVAGFQPEGGYDVIGFQECWQTGAANALIQLMVAQGYPFNRYNHGSGLLTVSKLPIMSSKFVEYNNENGILSCANDALKDKGFLYTELRKNDRCFIHFINTHLDAGDCNNDNPTRIKQLKQLDTWIHANLFGYWPHEGIFLVGDFNMHVNNSSEFPIMMQILNEFTPSFMLAGVPAGYNTVDYIFIDNAAGVSNVTHQFFSQGPSDHRPVESCMQYQCTQRPLSGGGGGDPDPCGGCPPGEVCIGFKCVPL